MDLDRRKRGVPREFDGIARGYDRLAALNPGYKKHLRWSAERLEAPQSGQILDLCCGTGLSTAALLSVYPEARIDAVDASAGMLDVAGRKGWPDNVRFVEGDAMDLPAAGCPGPYDGILMAYGIRNVPDADACLGGLRRALVPGGRICFHEYSVADSGWSRLVWRAVSTGVIIPAGRLASGRTDIYHYLRRSVLAFDGVAAFEERLRRAGFEDIVTRPMDGWQKGIVHSFLAGRPAQ